MATDIGADVNQEVNQMAAAKDAAVTELVEDMSTQVDEMPTAGVLAIMISVLLVAVWLLAGGRF